MMRKLEISQRNFTAVDNYTQTMSIKLSSFEIYRQNVNYTNEFPFAIKIHLGKCLTSSQKDKNSSVETALTGLQPFWSVREPILVSNIASWDLTHGGLNLPSTHRASPVSLCLKSGPFGFLCRFIKIKKLINTWEVQIYAFQHIERLVNGTKLICWQSWSMH